MTDHDSWVLLSPGNPYEPILYLFPDGLPVRDPFPMEIAQTKTGKDVALWTIDSERLDDDQIDAIALTIASFKNADVQEVVDEAIAQGGFGLDNRWVIDLATGSEGYARTLELREFVRNNPPGTKQALQAFRAFYQDQLVRWVEGDEVPPPLPESIDEVPEELRSPGLEQAIKRSKAQKILAEGNYSAFDMLTGRAMTDVLNQLDSDSSYEVVPLDVLFDD